MEVCEVEIAGQDQANAARFLGSPSVRVNGCDIEPGADDRSDFSLGCRLYGTRGIPPRELLVAALQES